MTHPVAWYADPANWHELSSIFPLIEGAEFDLLVTSIQERGVDNAIILLDDKVLDGRNRARACLRAKRDIGWEPEDFYVNHIGSPYAWVIGQNRTRRNMDKSQHAACATVARSCQNLTRDERKAVAVAFGISDGYLAEAVTLQAEKPKEFAQVHSGERNLSEFRVEKTKAKRRAEFAAVHDPGEIPQGQYQVVAADPPWPVGHATEQYSTMSIEAICALGAHNQTCLDKKGLPREGCHGCGGVMAAAAGDCILYLWAINLMLDEAFDVLRAWGFTYSGIITWNKTVALKDEGIERDDQGRAVLVRPTLKGQGAYYRNTTEHILVGVRGSMRPPDAPFTTQFYAPVQDEHSKKPDEIFWPMAMKMSPGPYLEMFARRRWSGKLLDGSPGRVDAVWGNQAPEDNEDTARRKPARKVAAKQRRS